MVIDVKLQHYARLVATLRDENEKLTNALGRLLATVDPGNVDEHEEGCMCVIHEARAALATTNCR